MLRTTFVMRQGECTELDARSAAQSIASAFEAEGVGVEDVRVIHSSPDNFGNWVLDVQTSIGRFHLIMDRGQLFVDSLIRTRVVMNCEGFHARPDLRLDGPVSVERLVGLLVAEVSAGLVGKL
jgi:hypothetical protein